MFNVNVKLTRKIEEYNVLTYVIRIIRIYINDFKHDIKFL